MAEVASSVYNVVYPNACTHTHTHTHTHPHTHRLSLDERSIQAPDVSKVQIKFTPGGVFKPAAE